MIRRRATAPFQPYTIDFESENLQKRVFKAIFPLVITIITVIAIF